MSGNDPPPPPGPSPRGPAPACLATTADIANLLEQFGALAAAMTAQSEATARQTETSARTLEEAERRFAALPTLRATVGTGMIAASAPFAVFGGVPVTTRTINDNQMVGWTVISCMERATIIDRDQLDKISKKIRRAITPGFQYIDINKLLESATGSHRSANPTSSRSLHRAEQQSGRDGVQRDLLHH
jgi:hypothetical protein